MPVAVAEAKSGQDLDRITDIYGKSAGPRRPITPYQKKGPSRPTGTSKGGACGESARVTDWPCLKLAILKGVKGLTHDLRVWQQGVASFAITANTVVCPLPSCVPDITITEYHFPT